MDERDIIRAVAKNCRAMDYLPEYIQLEIMVHAEMYDREDDLKRDEIEMERAMEEQRRKDEEERWRKKKDELLCAREWGENVPLQRRFALCEREVVIGGELSLEYCAIDLVREFKSPYWGYWSDAEKFYRERIRPVVEETDDDARARLISMDWNFFEIRYEERDFQFRVCSYETSPFRISGRSEAKTLAEHRAELMREFEKKGEADEKRVD